MFNRSIQTFSVLGISALLLLGIAGLASRNDAAAAAPNRDDPPTAQRVITVSGTGTATVQPDQATLTIGVQITQSTVAAATAEAGDRMSKVLDAIKAQGVDAKDIQTSNYSINPVTTYPDNQTPQVTGYQVMNVVNVTVKKLDTVGSVSDAGIAAGANYLGGITFGIVSPQVPQTTARIAAVKNATDMAQTLAQAAGVKLGRVIAISENTNLFQPPLPFKNASADSAGGIGPVASGSLDITSNVQIQFEITE